MKRSMPIIFLLIFTASFTIPAADVRTRAASSAQTQFVGTWELVSIQSRRADGEWALAPTRFGANPVGMIMYGPDAHMSAQIMNRDRPSFSEDDLSVRSAEELRGILAGYTAYFGTYEIDESGGFVIHKRQGHLNPNRVIDAKRFFEFNGNELTLTVAPARNLRLTWRRVGE